MHILIRHKVGDFARWKPAYDDHRPVRLAAGLKDLHLWRNSEDPSEIIILIEAADESKARDFVASDDLKEKMLDAGVIGKPEVLFLSES